MADIRPVWDIKDISEDDFRKVRNHGRIISVRADYEDRGMNEGCEYLVAVNSNGRSLRLPHNWKDIMEFRGWWSNPGMFQWAGAGVRALNRVREIEAWEKQHEADRAEYKRLKTLFDGV